MWQTDVRDLFRMSPADRIRRKIDHTLEELNSKFPHEPLYSREVPPAVFRVYDKGTIILELKVVSDNDISVAKYGSPIFHTASTGSALSHIESFLREYRATEYRLMEALAR
jgi:hypothetical protein